MDKTQRVPIHITLDADIDQALGEVAEHEDLTRAFLIRIAIKRLLADLRDHPETVTLTTGGIHDSGRNA
jgi:predicted transcriptional regulator